MKKSVSVLLVTIIMLGLFSGCSGGEKSEGVSTNNNTTIRFSFWEAGIAQEQETALKKIITEYKKVHPEVTVELMSQPNNGYQEWLKSRFLSNDAPEIISNHVGEVEKLYKQDYLYNFKEDLNAADPYCNNTLWMDTFIDGKLEAAHSYKYESSFAIPYFGMGIAYFYNKDIYKALNLEVPKTWDEFMSNCQKIQGDKINPIAMMLMKPDSVDWFTWYVTTGLFANKYLSNPAININQDKVITEQELAKAIDSGAFDITKGEDKDMLLKYISMAEQYSKYCEGASGLDEAGAKAQFIGGKAAHLMSGSWDLKAFMTDSTSGMNIGAFPMPRFTKDNYKYAGDNMTISAVQALCISNSVVKDEKKKIASVDFLKFLTSKDMYKIFVEDTFSIPSVKNIDVAPEFMSFTVGSVEPLNLYIGTSKTIKWNFQSTTIASLTGEQYDKEEVILELYKTLKERSANIKEKENVGPQNNYGIDALPKQGSFKPTE